MSSGTYTLLVELAEAATVAFGAKGEYDLDAGWYAYTGSAFGSGGLGRVDRHRELAAGERDARHWHVDYLLGHPETRVAAVYVTDEADVECETARALNDAAVPVPGLGASDCDCGTHLAYGAGREAVETVAAERHDRRV
ncbi:GIY-YIG nuclease family protein [Halobacterium sp. R2-5]|uniref:GIY-YIG nuclease family protein n=1 Tax=Halobacterium sp. R2-5 TaxID=2715751 RepID=UPI001420E15F|nr:GIY-YIG nuclease family protein [Halobacterium sp. R2-5]NIB99204.1 GIY-YIG nuclease family protein [Halobacterium sp. R2-5]